MRRYGGHLIGVRLHVVVKGTLLPEGHATVLAGVRLIARMDLLVIGQRCQLTKGLVATIAFIGFRIDVGAFMILQGT